MSESMQPWFHKFPLYFKQMFFDFGVEFHISALREKYSWYFGYAAFGWQDSPVGIKFIQVRGFPGNLVRSDCLLLS